MGRRLRPLAKGPVALQRRPLRLPVRFRINLGGYALFIAVAPANDLGAPTVRRKRVRVRRRRLLARLLCEHRFFYSWQRSRIVCVRCGSVRKIP